MRTDTERCANIILTCQINMMFAHLSRRVETDLETDNFVVIERLRFMKAVDSESRRR